MYQSCNIPSAPRQAWLLNLTARTSLVSYDGVGSTSKHLAVPYRKAVEFRGISPRFCVRLQRN